MTDPQPTPLPNGPGAAAILSSAAGCFVLGVLALAGDAFPPVARALKRVTGQGQDAQNETSGRRRKDCGRTRTVGNGAVWGSVTVCSLEQDDFRRPVQAHICLTLRQSQRRPLWTKGLSRQAQKPCCASCKVCQLRTGSYEDERNRCQPNGRKPGNVLLPFHSQAMPADRHGIGHEQPLWIAAKVAHPDRCDRAIPGIYQVCPARTAAQARAAIAIRYQFTNPGRAGSTHGGPPMTSRGRARESRKAALQSPSHVGPSPRHGN